MLVRFYLIVARKLLFLLPAAFFALLSGRVGTARAQSAADPAGTALRDPYAIQVNASEDAALVAGQLDSLRRRGVPAYRTQTTRGATTYHRVRVGPFAGRGMAQSFARCQGYADPWIVPAAADRDAFGHTATGLTTDVVPLRPRPPRFLLGQRHAVAALLMPAFGPSSAMRPATLRVYTPGRGEPFVIEDVTGVREAPDALEYGRAERVFVRDTSEAVAAYGSEIEAYGRQRGLSAYLVEDQLALYDEGRVARFTLLGRLPLPSGTPALERQPGFDYVNSRGVAMRHRGLVRETQARRVGNAAARRLRPSLPTQAGTPRTALFVRPTERGENAQVCVLFFAE